MGRLVNALKQIDTGPGWPAAPRPPRPEELAAFGLRWPSSPTEGEPTCGPQHGQPAEPLTESSCAESRVQQALDRLEEALDQSGLERAANAPGRIESAEEEGVSSGGAEPTEVALGADSGPGVELPESASADWVRGAKQPVWIRVAGDLAARLPDTSPCTLMVFAPGLGPIRGSATLQLAAALADRHDATTLVVDLDFQRPIRPDLAGLVEPHADRGPAAGPEDLVVATAHQRVGLLPLAGAVGPDRPPPSPEALTELLGALVPHYGLMLLGAGPALCEELTPLLDTCHGVILLVRLGHTPRRALGRLTRMARRGGGPVLGAVVIQGP
ncbi:MAG TPA: hypothetical protein EYH34_04125 [Planctomycetes bacterium]|nr:hypothetical protein [Planctomycetota bacterium]